MTLLLTSASTGHLTALRGQPPVKQSIKGMIEYLKSKIQKETTHGQVQDCSYQGARNRFNNRPTR